MQDVSITAVFEKANKHIFAECSEFDGDPVTTAWDINNGFCEDWANYVCTLLPGATYSWINELPHNCKPEDGFCRCEDNGYIPSHCVVKYRGLLYDAECHTGVKSWRKLPVQLHKGMTRAEVIKRAERIDP